MRDLLLTGLVCLGIGFMIALVVCLPIAVGGILLILLSLLS